MKKMAQLIRDNIDEFAYLEAVSMGKPVSTYFDASFAALHWDNYATLGWLSHGKTSINTPNTVGMTLRQPYGVTAAIIPWNVPMVFLSWKAAAALAAGNTVIVKSSEKAPLTVR